MLPVIGQGSWDVPERGARAREWGEALRRGVELGMTHIDTAEMYGAGAVEELLGLALTGIDRSRLFITSKVLPSNASRDGMFAACERSLRRLRLDHLDLYLLHWPSTYPLAETMNALEMLVEAGKTRFIGVSNFDVDAMESARSYLRRVPLACNQVLYHLRERGIEHRLLAAARQHDTAIVGYTPFGRGEFPRESAQPTGVLGRIACKYSATARQVILAFLTREGNLFAIPKAARMEHIEENAGAGALELDANDLALIDTAFPIGHEHPLVTL